MVRFIKGKMFEKSMKLKHLEDSLNDENALQYLKWFGELREPVKTVFGRTLDIASYLNLQGMSDQYGVFGGYAVLSNLMGAFGDDVAKVWRGSDDIDMAGTIQVLNSMRSAYDFTNDLPSPNIPSKRTLKIKEEDGEECKIDFYLGSIALKYGSVRTNCHFGIPVQVVKPEYIIKNKLYTPKGEIQHCADIVSMISVLESEGSSSKEIIGILVNQEFEELRRRIITAERKYRDTRFGFFPTKSYLNALKKELKRRKPIN
jgi:hypothetical protein